ncbi:MAG: glycyl-radical enzyme activating protein [Thermodesulfobacteriota bacterium]
MTAPDKLKAVVFDIQRFSLHDGPGIRTTVFFKGCPLSCLWCQNPESRKPEPEIAFYEERCLGCLACERACQEGAIRLDKKNRVDWTRCTSCGKCVPVCSGEALRMVGRSMSVSEVAAEVMADKDFFARSGGGATLSGGEPLMQPAFAAALADRLADGGVQTAVETCGQFSYSRASSLFPRLDLVLFDLKAVDGELHKKLTGRSNRTILENFSRLASDGVNLVARMPVIPGMNDSEENLRALAGFLKKQGKKDMVLLSYHGLWEAKLHRVPTAQKPLGLSGGPEAAERAKAVLAREGIHASCQD